jgi:hypothetical protein
VLTLIQSLTRSNVAVGNLSMLGGLERFPRSLKQASTATMTSNCEYVNEVNGERMMY